MILQIRSFLPTLSVLAFLAASATITTAAEPTTTKDIHDHPLRWTLDFATGCEEYIRQHVRDYSCHLIKRERIDGELQKHQFIEVKMRCEQRVDGRVVLPMAVFMHYLAPGTLKGRKVLYIDGQNDGMMQVVKGGRLLRNLKLDVDPNGRSARRESNHPVTDIGFDKIIQRLIERVADDIENDPSASNTQVSYFRNARVGKRSCSHIQVVHPQAGEGSQFHRASLYVDDELNVPIRLEVYDWAESKGEEPKLREEYTYVNLILNPGLSNAEFSDSRLKASSVNETATTASSPR